MRTHSAYIMEETGTVIVVRPKYLKNVRDWWWDVWDGAGQCLPSVHTTRIREVGVFEDLTWPGKLNSWELRKRHVPH